MGRILGQVDQIREILYELQTTGIYKPDILVGISNGGLFLADTSLRLVYGNDLPLISLWAQRSHGNYFDNPINNALITRAVFEQLVAGGDKNRKIRVLVMDDIVGTQQTFNQLVTYLQGRLGDMFVELEIKFVFLFTPRQETLIALKPYLLSQDPHISRDFRVIELEAVTGKSVLPYRKSIHYGSITASQEQLEEARDAKQGAN